MQAFFMINSHAKVKCYPKITPSGLSIEKAH